MALEELQRAIAQVGEYVAMATVSNAMQKSGISADLARSKLFGVLFKSFSKAV